MKPVIPFLLLLLLWQATAAQPYSCFMPGQRQFFVNDIDYLRGIEVKNVQAFAGYKIYSFFKTLRGSYTNTTKSILTPQGCWMGEDVVVYDDGMHTIETMWGDTVYIKTQAALGEEWVFHTGSNAPEYFKAKVKSIDTMTVQGTLDSVKTVQINAYFSNNPVTDPLNGYTFKLSKAHGFVETFELYTFPYHAPNAPIKQGTDYYFDKMGGVKHILFHICGFEPANDKLHDWQVGDVLEYTAAPMFYGPYPDVQVYFIDTVVAKQQGANWVSYETRGWRADLLSKTTTYPIQYTYQKTATALTRYYTDQWKFCNGYMPEEQDHFNLLYYREADTSHCVTGKWYKEQDGEMYKDNNKGEYYHLSFKEWGYHTVYKERIGLLDYFSGNHDQSTDSLLCYSWLNGTPCGRFYNLGTKDIPAKDNGIYLSPNPAQNYLTVELPSPNSDEPYTLTIVNMQGIAVSKTQSKQQKAVIDISNLPAGFYVLRIGNGGNVVNSNFIKS
jgi:hypothetical protein